LICTLYDFLPSKSILKYCPQKHLMGEHGYFISVNRTQKCNKISWLLWGIVHYYKHLQHLIIIKSFLRHVNFHFACFSFGLMELSTPS
jgi:uncharacterized protein YbcV (DUF1398 family)